MIFKFQDKNHEIEFAFNLAENIINWLGVPEESRDKNFHVFAEYLEFRHLGQVTKAFLEFIYGQSFSGDNWKIYVGQARKKVLETKNLEWNMNHVSVDFPDLNTRNITEIISVWEQQVEFYERLSSSQPIMNQEKQVIGAYESMFKGWEKRGERLTNLLKVSSELSQNYYQTEGITTRMLGYSLLEHVSVELSEHYFDRMVAEKKDIFNGGIMDMFLKRWDNDPEFRRRVPYFFYEGKLKSKEERKKGWKKGWEKQVLNYFSQMAFGDEQVFLKYSEGISEYKLQKAANQIIHAMFNYQNK